jgi:hypothetical protein
MGAAGIILLISQAAGAATILTPVIINVIQALKTLLHASGIDINVQVLAIQDGAIKTATETEDFIAEWRKAHPGV